MKKIILVIAILATFYSKAQGFAINTGYNYIGSGVNAGYLGVDYRVSNYHQPSFNVGIGGNFTKIDNQFTIIPVVKANYNLNNVLLLDINTSQKFTNPSIGINFLNLIQIKTGYSFWHEDKNYNSVTFGVNIFIGEKYFYDYLKIGW